MRFSNEFNDRLKKYRNEEHIQLLENKRHIKEEHKHFINTVLGYCNGKNWTVSKIKHELESKFDDIQRISKSMVNRCLMFELK